MKINAFILVAVATLGLFTACEPKQELTLSQNVLSLTVGDMATLTATANPSAEIAWTSSDDSVATVFHGVVTATGVGNATITASANGATATCIVYSVGASGITLSLSPYVVEMQKGETRQLNYHDVYGVPLTWSSAADSVATVDQNGVVTAHKAGNALITLSNGAEEATCLVVVAHKWSEYQLVWSEEFNGTALDESVWNIEVNGGGGGNWEKQYYTARPENLRVKEGCLEVEARKEAYTINNRTWDYTSARINTKNKKAFKYGKIEARMWLPAGGGTWPAFWMMGNDYDKVGWLRSGEIDIMEHVGNKPGMVSFAVHTSKKNGTGKPAGNWGAQKWLDGIENNWHTYGIIWEEEVDKGRDRIIFTVDGEECASVLEDLNNLDDNAYWPFNKEYFIILNLALGGSLGGNIDDSIFANNIIMKVDWVHVYQRQEIE